ncbi:MAG TPA: polysaccharide biosynthesis protein [Candidatus Acetatifactor stercoripullorum]|uniref:Polysaccharide biosynthesis protein n=1 Tax=Candidatus Acetatifactor stercoripullorum TaxID=2838414 RepID=A0A9D1R8Z2_9FIRM|nr:nucleoside-diphosphate sugar epimerase/dehydratase [uncultured Acetatifactor sp.]HIW82166.1 polysaccharide biosynthesis protein [Candidatus Acetatifactor stercoripullorum]
MKRLNDIRVGILKIPVTRIALLVVSDMVSILVASVLSLYVRYDFKFMDVPREFWVAVLDAYWYNAVIVAVVFAIFKLYNSVWRYASDTELVNNAIAVVICSIMQPIIFWLEGVRLPTSYPFFYGFFLMILTCGIRFSYRILRILQNRRLHHFGGKSRINCMIVGAGAAGNAILKEIESSSYLSIHVACAIDDNPGCHGKYLRGVPIVGGRESIPDNVEKYNIDEIIIAIPSASRQKLKPILEICKETGCRLRILPGMYQIINGDVNVSKLREVQIEDLLGRDPIEVNVEEIMGYVKDKVVLVTGGGGSIGSELCRQIAQHAPKRLVIFDIYENSVYEIQQELKQKYPKLDMVVLIGSVRNTARVNEIFKRYRPDIVYHAAAHKHVPLMEDSPNEAVKNNVFGTYKVATAADRYGTKRFVLISTDKAVNPTNIMGASKRICEMIIQNLNRSSKTEYVAVRFGNVLGSNGSVIPLFKKQIEQGGPVTVTSPDIIRYFMTIPEAVSLVLQAGAYAKGGEIFVLDMGEPMKIVDLAKNLIKLSGYRVGEDIKIEFIGLRPGEKMYEELLMNEEGLQETANKMIYIGRPIEYDADVFEKQLERLRQASLDEESDIRRLVREIVPTYHYEE